MLFSRGASTPLRLPVREFSTENCSKCGQRDARLVKPRLARGEPLQSESRQKDDARKTRQALNQLPELHRERQREHRHDDRCENGRRQGPEAAPEDGDRHQQRGEVRAAAHREARGQGCAMPGLPKTPLLECGDRTVLGTVQVERAAAQEPAQQSEGRDETCGEPQPARSESEHQWSDDRRDQKEPLAAARRNVSVTLTIPKKLRKAGKFTVTVTGLALSVGLLAAFLLGLPVLVATVYAVMTWRGFRIGAAASTDYGFFLATVVALTIAAAVGVSRTYADAHWTTDVVGGWALGGAAAAVSALWYERLRAD